MNKVILVGNLTRDPELSTIPSGVSVCRFSIAVNRRFKNANGEQDVDFFNIVVWRQQAENCGQYLHKGSKVAVVGQLQNRTFEQDGVRRYVTEVIADEVEFLSPKSDNSQSGEYRSERPVRAKVSPKEMQPMEDDDLPF